MRNLILLAFLQLANPCQNRALDEGGSSDESVRYDIWVTPKSPGAGSIPSTLSGEINADLNSKIESQFAHYKAIVRPAIDADVFCWWRDNAQKFPELARLARIFLTTPATSVCSERVFSKAGLLYANSLRNRLSGEMAQNLLIIKANMNKLFLGPSNDIDDEEKDDENNDNEAK
ncbi:hypothetical protein niasHT_039723 [Heterodera trifolii]|uniref:HAT C-terminal dimerisation domain-containing protein n=1 Tax=Heterodera trifolii TaxID=157864 RepID=A0ABD2J1N2_9BILA